MNEWSVLAAAILGLALVAYVFQEVEPLTGRRLWLYLGAVGATAVLGALVFVELDLTPVFGVISGVATVPLSKTVGVAARQAAKKIIGKFSDRFAPDKAPGFSGDTDEEA